MWTASARHQYRRSGGRYATDVTDAEFALIGPLLRRPRTPAAADDLVARGAERPVAPASDRLPMAHAAQGIPAAKTIYGYFRRFWQEGIWSTIQMTLLMAGREQAGREASPTAGIIDSQSVKTTEAGGPRGFDAGKKVNGRERHLLTDTLGLPRWLVVDAANVQTATGWSWSAPTSVDAFLGCGICSPMPATRARSPGAPPRANDYSSRSSSARATPRASTCCPAGGSLSVPSPGSAATVGSPRTSSTLSTRPPPWPPSPHPDAHAQAGKPLINNRNLSDGL